MKNQKKEDRRVIYTKKVIRDSFLQLLSEKPVEKISVTEICKNADINRGTFYAHYSDPYDLKLKLTHEIVGIITERTQELIDPESENRDPIQMLNILQQNRELCRIFAAPYGDFDTLVDIIDKQLVRYLDFLFDSTSGLSSDAISCLRLMSTAAVAALVKFWMDNDMRQEPEVILNMMSTFCRNGIHGYINGDVKLT